MSGVPKFYGLWKNKGVFNLLFEFIPGDNLSKIYNKLSSKEKFQILRQFSIILDNIHKKKLIHRDIKPSNIMVSEGLKVTLIDFGVSKISSKTITNTASQSGTTRYLAPEVFDVDVETESDKPIRNTTKLDIWSTGCMISELFSGILPWFHKYKNENILKKKLMQKIAFDIPDEIIQIEKKESIEVCDLIKKCTIIDQTQRVSAGELKLLIEEKLEKYYK